jgi:hypothetical protein
MGLLGVLTLWLIPLPTDIELPASETVIKLASLGQSAIILAIAVLIGLFTAPKVGLRAPFFQALLTDAPVGQALAPQLIPGLIGGLLGALAIFVYGLLQPMVTPELVTVDAPIELPLLMRVLYGGVTEELLMRWGLMSFLVWLGWRTLQRGQGATHSRWLWLGVGLAALLFGVGHLPAASAFGMLMTPLRIGFIIFFNTIAGLIFGWLYWRKGLESAIIAHASTHLIAALVLLPLFG